MNEDALRKGIRSGGCRLCLAPDTECVPIFATAAADKEPLSHKILSCVNIKVSDKTSNIRMYLCYTSMSLHPPIYQSLRDCEISTYLMCRWNARKKREKYPKIRVRLIWKCARHILYGPSHDTTREKSENIELRYNFFFRSFGQSSSHRRGRWLSISVASQSMYGMSYVCQLGSINRK